MKRITRKRKPVKAWWFVVDWRGVIYSASNGRTKADAVLYHEGALGAPWKRLYAEGDRLTGAKP